MQDLHISMLGAQGTGKSSLLASMFQTFKKNAGELGFLMKPASTNDSIRLVNKHREMLKHLAGVRGDPEGVPASSDEDEYILDLGFKGLDIDDYWLKLHFWDFPGGWLTDKRERVVEQLKISQVILIAIDSPSLLFIEKSNLQSWRYWHDTKNAPTSLVDIFSEVDFKEPKLILFVPIKCEAWRTSKNDSQFIVEQVKKGYDGLITHLKDHSDSTLAITPVQTLGNYHFSTRLKERDIFRPKNIGTGGSADYAPQDVDQPLIYMLSFLGQQVKAFLESTAKNVKTIDLEQGVKTGVNKIILNLTQNRS